MFIHVMLDKIVIFFWRMKGVGESDAWIIESWLLSVPSSPVVVCNSANKFEIPMQSQSPTTNNFDIICPAQVVQLSFLRGWGEVG